MLGFSNDTLWLPQVSSDGTVEQFQHESEEGTGQRGIPSSLGGFITDESVLGLDFEELARMGKLVSPGCEARLGEAH